MIRVLRWSEEGQTQLSSVPRMSSIYYHFTWWGSLLSFLFFRSFWIAFTFSHQNRIAEVEKIDNCLLWSSQNSSIRRKVKLFNKDGPISITNLGMFFQKVWVEFLETSYPKFLPKNFNLCASNESLRIMLIDWWSHFWKNSFRFLVELFRTFSFGKWWWKKDYYWHSADCILEWNFTNIFFLQGPAYFDISKCYEFKLHHIQFWLLKWVSLNWLWKNKLWFELLLHV